MMNIIIIGAGAAGLMAAHLLSAQGHTVTLLEARDRTGGRIHTLQEGRFSKPVDLGAEFVHGNLPITLGLLKEAGISYHALEGEMWHFREGRFYQDEENAEHWGLLMQKLDALEEDLPIRTFLTQEFPGERYSAFRESIERYVQGLDAADPSEASSIALREEWNGEDEDQYAIEGGYGRLIHYLENRCRAQGVTIQLNSPVSNIDWQEGSVNVRTVSGNEYEADKLIVTVPIGVLQAATGAEGALQFAPGLPAYLAAAKEIGSGNALKILLQFREPFWKKLHGHDLEKMSFLLSTASIPTWWTQYPQSSSLLTGWLGGPRAYEMKDISQEEMLHKCLLSLSEIFGMPAAAIQELLDDWRMHPWPADPYSRGSYSYAKVGTPKALSVLATPVASTIYFAGEAIYDGHAMGTVEAALSSGQDAVQRLLKGTEA